VVGYGRASKEQVRAMVKIILKLDTQLSLDTADALAIAICHHNWVRFD
jgi:crossover junction endodeoxyribonuclease RuvC